MIIFLKTGNHFLSLKKFNKISNNHLFPRKYSCQYPACHAGDQTSICFLGSIVVSIPACHAGDRGSIPRREEIGNLLLFFCHIRTVADGYILNNRK